MSELQKVSGKPAGSARSRRRLLQIGAAALACGCAPTVQRAQAQIPSDHRPHFDVASERFHSFDGAPLGLSAWLPQSDLLDSPEPWAVIVGLHGMNDYGAAFFPAGPWFAERGVAVYAYDARGFGRSPNRGVWAGQRLMTEDLRAAIAAARERHPRATLAVVGDSMGAACAITAFGSDAPPSADRVVLVAPAVWGWSSLPDSYAVALWAGAHMFPWRPVTAPRRVQRRVVASDNIEMLRRIGRDPNMIFETRIDALYGLVSLMEQASERTSRLSGDIAYLYGARDQIIPRAAALQAARALPSSARTALYPDGYHMLLRDLQAERVYDDILSFLRDPASPFPSQAPPLIPIAQANR